MVKVKLALLLSSSLFLIARTTADDSLRGGPREFPKHRQLQLSGAVIGLRLINTVTNKPLADSLFYDGAIININNFSMSEPAFNIEAVTLDLTNSIKSVVFSYNGVKSFTETKKPYAFCGDVGGVFKMCPTLSIGVHTVTATPWSSTSGTGTRGPSVTFTFAIERGIAATPMAPVPIAAPVPFAAPAPVVASVPVAAPVPVVAPATAPVPIQGIVMLKLIYTGVGAKTNTAVADLIFNGLTTVNVPSLGLASASFNIEAVQLGGFYNVVTFTKGSYTRKESVKPYAYCGDNDGVFKTCGDLSYGDHIVTVTPDGQPGFTATIRITNSLPAPAAVAPIAPAPVAVAPIAPAPVAIAPIAPAPVAVAPIASAPVAVAPIAPAPVAVVPIAPAPVAVAPIARAPIAVAPIAPAPIAVAPIAPAPIAVAPIAPAPVAHAPIAPAPVAVSPIEAFVLGNLTNRFEGLLLSQGLTAQVIARSGNMINFTSKDAQAARSSIPFHMDPDGAAIFELNDGAYVYVSNSETSNGMGGVYGIEFDRDGNVRDYRTLLAGTNRNCNGGRTPWGTWVSCEEVQGGQCHQVDPRGSKPSKPTVLGGATGGRFEAMAYDDRMGNLFPTFFVTEDDGNGALRRFRPGPSATNGWDMLHGNGTIDYLEFVNGTSFRWTSNLTNGRMSAQTYFPNCEGIVHHEGILMFVSKTFKQLFRLDLDKMTYKSETTKVGNLQGGGSFGGGPDQLLIDSDGSFYFTEDGGSSPGVFVYDGLKYRALLEAFEPRYDGDETTGMAFSPDHKFLFFCIQEYGILFRVSRIDERPFDGRRVLAWKVGLGLE